LGQLLDMRFRFSLSSYAYFAAHMAEGSCSATGNQKLGGREDVLL
jgi:hypothetical protein